MGNLINLVKPHRSTVKITVSTYPDTQVNVIIDDQIDLKSDWHITSRFSTYSDLMTILAVNQVLRDSKVKSVNLLCPYIMGARSDSKFKPRQSFDLKIISQLLNSAKFDRVYILDPHSAVTPALIENSEVISAHDGFISWINNPTVFWEGKTLISPDAGSFKKVLGISKLLNVPLISASKARIGDSIETVFEGNVNGLDCVIIDDICDGGRTFEQLSLKLKLAGAKTVTLCVTHGIFSKGLTLEHIDQIYTTNSYREFDTSGISDKFHVIDIY